jgi:hypothetical protein
LARGAQADASAALHIAAPWRLHKNDFALAVLVDQALAT